MKRKSFEDMDCAVALALEEVGEWWSLLIIRDALQGSTRFEQFRSSLQISPTMLTRRLNELVSSGLLTKVPSALKAGTEEYRVTDKGRDLSPVLVTLFAWGRKHAGKRKWGIDLIDRKTGKQVAPVVIDRNTGHVISRETHAFVQGDSPSQVTAERLPKKADALVR
ncbi:helix-turn-helix domain-containing protein [Paraburkholderia sp. SIMBA_055]